MKNIEIYIEVIKIIKTEIKKQPLLPMFENLYKTVSERMPYIRHDILLNVLAFELREPKMRKEFQMAYQKYQNQIEKIWASTDKK